MQIKFENLWLRLGLPSEKVDAITDATIKESTFIQESLKTINVWSFIVLPDTEITYLVVAIDNLFNYGMRTINLQEIPTVKLIWEETLRVESLLPSDILFQMIVGLLEPHLTNEQLKTMLTAFYWNITIETDSGTWHAKFTVYLDDDCITSFSSFYETFKILDDNNEIMMKGK